MYFGLQNILSTRCLELSAGNQKKVALARLIACQSKFWLLDEVDSNLDDEAKKKLMHLIISHADNGGIAFLASHDPDGHLFVVSRSHFPAPRQQTAG